jgi:TrwC relaxase
VLSIGKLSAGQASYYLDQAEARVDAVTSIGGGVEDYYVGSGEARGVWVGTGSAALGIAGEVDGDALRSVLAGDDPVEGGPLRSSSSPVRVAGFDLTFSAPKSVSVIFGIGDEPVRTAVAGACTSARTRQTVHRRREPWRSRRRTRLRLASNAPSGEAESESAGKRGRGGSARASSWSRDLRGLAGRRPSGAARVPAWYPPLSSPKAGPGLIWLSA